MNTRLRLPAAGLTVVVLAFAFFATASSVAVSSAAAAERPNIVFVLFDDLGYGQPSSYRGNTEFKMPNLDRLAAEGMQFTDAHSAASVCTPTRYGVLTGRYPSRIGQFGVLTTYSPPIIPASRMTVASLLKAHGYHTACIGKWHLGLNWVDGQPGTQKLVPVGCEYRDGPNAVGFDYFYGYTHARNISSVLEQGRVVENIEAVESQPLMIRKAMEYFESRAGDDTPFFLYFPMCPPHNPIVPAPEYVGKSGLTDPKDGPYGDWIIQGDDMLGQILEALERTGKAENTLVIATGDNGAAGRSYEPLRGSKSSIYEGGHREPFVVRWPGKVEPGTVNDDTVCLNDLLATCAEIVGAKLPDDAGEDSVSLLPYFTGSATGPVREATIHQAPTGEIAIRQGPWKLIFAGGKKRELYNLRSDLSETQDVAAANPEVVRRLTELMQRYIDRGRSTAGASQSNEFAISLDAKNRKKPTEDIE